MGLVIATCEDCGTTLSRPDPDVEGYEEGDLERYEEEQLKDNPPMDYEELDEEQQLLMDTIADYWIEKGFIRGRAKIMPTFEEGGWYALSPEDLEDPPWEWLEYLDAWQPLAIAVIFTEYSTPKPYDQGAYHGELDAVLEPLGYRHYIVNDAVVVIMIDPYSDEGERIMSEHD